MYVHRDKPQVSKRNVGGAVDWQQVEVPREGIPEDVGFNWTRKRRDLSPLEEVDGLECCRTVRSGSGVCHCK